MPYLYPIGPRELRPPAPICESCRRFIARADGHRCDVLRDYERMENHR